MYKKKSKKKSFKINKKRTLRRKKVVGGDHELAPGFSESINFDSIVKTNVEELKQKYTIKDIIGSGVYGNVNIWENNETKKTYAIKQMKYKTDNDIIPYIQNEIYILKFLIKDNKCREHILCYRGVLIDKSVGVIYLATDYDPNDVTLEAFLKQKNNTDKDLDLIKIFSQIVETILLLQDLNICHNDLKPANILIDNTNFNIKIIDFGFACFSKNEKNENMCNINTLKGTNHYIDPYSIYYYNNINNMSEDMKKLYEDNYKKCDFWSLGIIFLKIFFKDSLNFMIQLDNINTFSYFLFYFNNYTKIITNSSIDNVFIDNTESKDYNANTLLNYIKNAFTKVIPISDTYFNKAIQDNIPFARIEDLLNLDLSKRYIFSKKDMKILNYFSTLTFSESEIAILKTKSPRRIHPIINAKIYQKFDNSYIGNINDNEYLLREINRIIDGKFPTHHKKALYFC